MNDEYLRLIGQDVVLYHLGYVDVSAIGTEDHLFLNTWFFLSRTWIGSSQSIQKGLNSGLHMPVDPPCGLSKPGNVFALLIHPCEEKKVPPGLMCRAWDTSG